MLVKRPNDSTQTHRDRTLNWEETACLLCGRDEAELVVEAPDPLPANGAGLRFAVVRCRRCDLVYTNPRPTAESIGNFYPLDYIPYNTRDSLSTRKPSRLRCLLFGRPCRERRGVLPWNGAGRLLDFGCGAGLFLERMAELGWKVSGIDVSTRVVDRIRSELGLTAHSGTLPHAELETGSFDVITMWQSLEHVHSPLRVLRSAYELLSPGGKLVVSVPNYASLTSSLFGNSWMGLDVPRHLTHFTPATLEGMLRAAGFQIDELRGVVHAEWMRSSARRAIQHGTASALTRALTWKPLARMVTWFGYVLGRADSLLVVARRPG